MNFCSKSRSYSGERVDWLTKIDFGILSNKADSDAMSSSSLEHKEDSSKPNLSNIEVEEDPELRLELTPLSHLSHLSLRAHERDITDREQFDNEMLQIALEKLKACQFAGLLQVDGLTRSVSVTLKEKSKAIKFKD